MLRSAIVLYTLAIGLTVEAQTLPWKEEAPRVEGDEIICAALGTADYRIDSWTARRLSARRRGQQRAKQMLHRWIDDALARVGASPLNAQAVHQLVVRARIRSVRPLVDGSAIVEITMARSALREIMSAEGLPW